MKELLGLSSEEAQHRFREYGPNEIVPSRVESRLAEIKKVLLDPMGLMLLALAAVYALLGNSSDAIVLLIAYVPVTAVDVFLELRAQKALQSLKSNLARSAKIIRDGNIQDIPIRLIVPGDVIVFEEGQSFPADGKILEAEQILVNEASLTGESIPIDKNKSDQFAAGTMLIQGRGLGFVEATGKQTQFGKIALLLEKTLADSTPLQKKVQTLVRKLLIVAFVLACGLFALDYYRHQSFGHSLIIALTFGMSAVPEEFPLVFTLYLSIGAWRLSRHGVLVKSLPSVEALGSVDLICTDKTGTLTEGRFDLEKIEPLHPAFSSETLWMMALMACEEKAVDSMEIAIMEKGKDSLDALNHWKLKWDYAFEPRGKHMSHVWEFNHSERAVIAMKGSVEGVLEHCSITEKDRLKIQSWVDQYAGQGKRLLALAYREGPMTGDRLRDESNLQFLGLMVFHDPVRPSAVEAIQKCQQAGIQIKMLTGDHPLTAHAVADQTGISHNHDDFFTGHDLAAMAKEERWKSYQRGTIFSRVLPEQKHEMIQAFKAQGRIVAMTGDGVNDAPALKLADIGISMGANATDVARSTAQMILMKNDFKGIVEAVFEGRRIFANLRRSFSYLVSFHLPVILLTLVPPLFGWGEILLPIHIVLLEMIVHPISAFSFENLPSETSLTNEKTLLPTRRFLESLLSGALLSFVSLYLFRRYELTFTNDTARAIALSTVLLGNLFFVIVETWPHKTPRVLITLVSLLGLSLFISEFEPASNFLHLGELTTSQFLEALFVSLLASVPSFLLRRSQSMVHGNHVI